MSKRRDRPASGNAHYFFGLLILQVLLGGCATNSVDPDDPFEPWNRGVYEFNDAVDINILKPMAEGYVWTTPEVIDHGVTNFFSNIQDIAVTINDLLQFKFEQFGMDGSRFLINTTVGVAGVVDVATSLGLPKHIEDFDQTLGVWGVPQGPYLVLPFWGPSSPRGVFGLVGDALMDPLTYTFFFGGTVVTASTIGAAVLDVTDTRAGLLIASKIVEETSLDRYDFLKSAYRQRREYLILDGNVPDPDENFELDESFDESFE